MAKKKTATNRKNGKTRVPATNTAEENKVSRPDFAADDGDGANEQRPGKQGCPIVGIGASAGGLEAFEQFFRKMPPDSGMGFVLIPHLDPSHKSIMPELLQRDTKMSVVQAEEGAEVRPNHVYIIPPNRDMAILNRKLVLLEPIASRATRHPVDYFFRSLAQDQGENSVAVILSGTGTEGTLGLKAIKGEGGLVIAQEPKDAKYDGMPGSAVATGLVDFVVPASKIADILVHYGKHTLKSVLTLQEKPEGREVDPLQGIFTLIRTHTSHDFSLYKQNTILRRIERRMAVHRIDDISGYVTYMRNNISEIDILFKELLIRVTNFFRDREAFEALKQKALPIIAKNKSYENPLRVWVPGCSTGEEAYSLAIILHEYAQNVKNTFRIQIFATDIDTSAVDIARAGVYTENISVDVSQERLSRYFVKQGNTFRIKDEIREMIIFSVQNITKDPPFSKLDLISCRNLLIYLGSALQKKVLPVFHYALNPGGVLFLGTSENVGDAVDMFGSIDKKWKIFQARKVEVLSPALPDLRHAGQLGKGVKHAQDRLPAKGREAISELTEQLLLDQYTPATVIVNEQGDIRYIHGRTGKYLEPASGRANMNIIDMAREGLRPDLRASLRKAVTGKKNITARHLQVRSNGGFETIDLEVNYITRPENLEGLIMVVFKRIELPVGKKALPAAGKGSMGKKNAQRLSELEFELKSTKENLQTSIEALEISNEELKATNEELQSSNEELQSTNEELETSKEELQSVNEELMTVNAELQSKLDELTLANNDMMNLISSTQIATMFLDTDFRIKNFTPEMVKIFNLIQTDLGRPITDIASRLEYPGLLSDTKEVLRTLMVKEITVRHLENRWYIIRILPYRTISNMINGVVITFVDITQQKAAESLKGALTYARGIIETIRDPLLVLDADLKVLSANAAFYRMFQVSSPETEGHLIYDLGNRQWDIPALRELMEKVLPSNARFEGFIVKHEFPGIGFKKLSLNGRRIMQEGMQTETILLAIEDRTED